MAIIVDNHGVIKSVPENKLTRISFINNVLCDDIARINQQDIEYIYNSDFKSLTLEAALKSSNRGYLKADSSVSDDSEQPSYIAALYTIPLLTPTGESTLFRNYNYLKYWAHEQRNKLNRRKPTLRLVRRVLRGLEEAGKIRNQIIESNLRLVVSLARKFCSDRASFDELVSEGNTILMKAVEKFDYARGFRFSTYVTHSVQRHFYRHFQHIQRRKFREVSTAQEILNDSVSATDMETVVDTGKTHLLISQMKQCLDEREQLIVRERCGFGPSGTTRTYQSLSDELGICKERVRQVFQAAIDKLRNLATELKLDVSSP